MHLIEGNTGTNVDYLLNESSGTTTASMAFNVDENGTYRLEVDNVRGDWSLTISHE